MESPILVLYGEDTYSLKQAEQELVDRLVDPGFASLNLNVIEGTTTPPSQVVSAALTMPFGPGARVVLVRDCPYFGTGRFEGSDEVEAIAELAAYWRISSRFPFRRRARYPPQIAPATMPAITSMTFSPFLFSCCTGVCRPDLQPVRRPK